MVSKVAPSSPWSEKSRRLRDGLESCAVSALFWKVAPYAPWAGLIPLWLLKSRRIHHGRKELFLSCAVSALVWKVTPSHPWSEKSRRLRLGLKSRAVSTLNVKVTPLLLRSQRIDSCSRRLRLGLESRAVSTSTVKVLKVDFLVALARPVAPLLSSPEKLALKNFF